jgi:DNA repair exonuclease SbcCD ATPase subunit
MKIIELKSSNIKKIKAVELVLDDKKNIVMITGRNGQGKTSILDSIWYALGGKRAVQEKPIRHGEEEAEVEINVDGYIVKRSFTEKGSYLSVSGKDGEKYSNPQEFLDYIVGNLSFDPLEFSRMESKKQIEVLTGIVGIDINEFDSKKKALTEERVMVGREGKVLAQHTESEVAEAEKLKDQPEISITELSDKISVAKEEHSAYIRAKDEIGDKLVLIKEAEDGIKELQAKVKAYKVTIENLTKVKDTAVNIDELKKQIDNADSKNVKIREAKQVLDDSNKVAAKKKEYTDLTDKILAVDKEKKDALAKAKMPIEGLSWEEDLVLYNGIPYSQISGAEQLRVSMAIAMASNPKLRVILVRDGSLLDKDNMSIVAEMAKDKDFQVWIESVDDTGKVGIYIEEGEIKKVNK